MAPDDLMGDPGPAEAMVRRAVEAEREAIAATLADEAAFFRREAEEASKTRRFYCEGYARLLERHAAAIRRRGE